MLLTDRAIKNIKAGLKAKKYADGEGLILFVSINGTKSWRFRYRDITGKQKELTFGTYPEVSLLDARTKKVEARCLLRENIDPIQENKERELLAIYNAKNTFLHVATEWYDLNKDTWTKKHSQKIWSWLDTYVFPKIGSKAISKITALEVLDNIIRGLEKEGKTETAHKILQNCTAIFRLALLTKRVPYNPLTDLRGVLKPHRYKNLPTIGIGELPEFMRKLENHKTSQQNKLAIKMLLLTFVRHVELRKAKWKHIDFEKRLWCIPAELMKMRKEHIVPLADQTIKLLKKIQKISGQSEYIFPTKNKIKYPYMSEHSIHKVIYALGYKDKLVAHGFRSLASTNLNELGHSPDIIEKQLAHTEKNRVRAAYNRAEYLPQRIKMMQFWADYLDTIILN